MRVPGQAPFTDCDDNICIMYLQFGVVLHCKPAYRLHLAFRFLHQLAFYGLHLVTSWPEFVTIFWIVAHRLTTSSQTHNEEKPSLEGL